MKKMKKKIWFIPVCILSVFILIKLLHGMDYVYKNYIERWIFAKEESTKELMLEYVGMQAVDLEQSEMFFEDSKNWPEYTNAWQILSYQDYAYFKDEIGFENSMVGVRCFLWDDVYVISYGRKITSATYDPSEYFGAFGGTMSPSYSNGGYAVSFAFDETEYYENVVFIYKCDRIKIANYQFLM